MKPEEKRKVASTLSERGRWVRIGLLLIHLKPITLEQIYEIGEFTCQMQGEDIDLEKKVVVSAEMLARYKDARLMQEVYLRCAFRTKWKRRLFRSYILKRLTVLHFQKGLAVIKDAFTANFFLTSIIFLHKTTQITEPSQTIARGQSSEE